MKGKVSKWVAALGVGALALALFSGWAFAHGGPEGTPAPGGWGWSWEEMEQMHAWCHGEDDTGAGHIGYDPLTLGRVAQLLGTTTDEMAAQLQEGKSLLEVAQAKGVTEQALIEAILAPVKESLQLRVRYGYLTQEQADEVYQRQVEATKVRITRRITPATGTTTPQGYGWGPGGMMGGRGMMGGHDGMHGGWGSGFGGMMRSLGMGFMGR